MLCACAHVFRKRHWYALKDAGKQDTANMAGKTNTIAKGLIIGIPFWFKQIFTATAYFKVTITCHYSFEDKILILLCQFLYVAYNIAFQYMGMVFIFHCS